MILVYTYLILCLIVDPFFQKRCCNRNQESSKCKYNCGVLPKLHLFAQQRVHLTRACVIDDRCHELVDAITNTPLKRDSKMKNGCHDGTYWVCYENQDAKLYLMRLLFAFKRLSMQQSDICLFLVPVYVLVMCKLSLLHPCFVLRDCRFFTNSLICFVHNNCHHVCVRFSDRDPVIPVLN